ncbi:MAG TPA: DUF2065 domain-containing protein [Syntrophobacteraceae bacterium]|nr:DUF2065 domain-containing protein [Syntrophobacteraceae bacterium]
MMHAYILTVIGLICFLEGLPYLASPGQVRKWLNWLLSVSTLSLRIMGAALMVAGLLLVYLGRKNGG